MLLSVILRGFLIGFVASAFLGPIGVLCIQRTLSKNQKSGFVSGLGMASADTFYSAIAFFSLSFVLHFIEDHLMVIKIIGVLCVMAVGVKIFFSNPVVQIRRNRAGKSNLWQDFISVLLLTLANPAFILVFIFLFAAFGVSNDTLGMFNGWFMIAGVFAGASSWWFLVTAVVSLFRKKFRPRHMLWINRISGGIIVALGIITIILIILTPYLDGLTG